MATTYNVLFLCTGNSARSQMAEVLLNALGEGRFRAFSAGSHPAGVVHPLTLELVREHGLDVQELRTKSWEEFSAPSAPAMDFIITVCDKARGESCPAWPGHPALAHWGVPDPAASGERQAFRDAWIVLRRRIELLLALPLQSLDKLAREQRLDAIGNKEGV